MLHHQRKRQKELAAAEAEGKSFWTASFSAETRLKLICAFLDTMDSDADRVFAAQRARALILRDEGLISLTAGRSGTGHADLNAYMRIASDELVPSVLDARLQGIFDACRSNAPLLGDEWMDFPAK
jgi:hypothetical protein